MDTPQFIAMQKTPTDFFMAKETNEGLKISQKKMCLQKKLNNNKPLKIFPIIKTDSELKEKIYKNSLKFCY